MQAESATIGEIVRIRVRAADARAGDRVRATARGQLDLNAVRPRRGAARPTLLAALGQPERRCALDTGGGDAARLALQARLVPGATAVAGAGHVCEREIR